MAERFIVARFVNAGMGDHVSCLLGAWRYANLTGRSLVIDWRGSRYNLDPSRNCYTDFFAPLGEVEAVRTSAGADVPIADLPAPFWPEKWTSDSLRSTEAVGHTPREIAEVDELVRSGVDRPEPTVIFNQAVAAAHRCELAAMSRRIVLAPRLQEQVRTFADAAFGGRKVFGIHLRHGNGENIGKRANHWIGGIRLLRQLRLNKQNDVHARNAPAGRFLDHMAPSLIDHRDVTFTERSLYRRIAREFSSFRARHASTGAVAFLCTDSQHVVDQLRRRLPELTTFPTQMKEPGSGPLHAIEDAKQKVSDQTTDAMLIEMALLRQSSRLVCMPSQFNLLARLELPAEDVVLLKPPLMNRVIYRLFA